jgi:hypothetical protein
MALSQAFSQTSGFRFLKEIKNSEKWRFKAKLNSKKFRKPQPQRGAKKRFAKTAIKCYDSEVKVARYKAPRGLGKK